MDECSTGLNNHLSPTDRFRSYIIEFIRSNDLDDTHQTNSSARVKSVKSSKHNGVLVTRPAKDRTQILKKMQNELMSRCRGLSGPFKSEGSGCREEGGKGKWAQSSIRLRGQREEKD